MYHALNKSYSDFTEVMRNLGYPGMISMDSFTSPNFVLVADILYWLVQRYDPSTDLDDSISTETERIQFLKSAAQEMVSYSVFVSEHQHLISNNTMNNSFSKQGSSLISRDSMGQIDWQ